MPQPVGAQVAAGATANPLLLPLPRLAKVENPLRTWLLPQEGQVTFASADMLRTNLSNRSLHW